MGLPGWVHDLVTGFYRFFAGRSPQYPAAGNNQVRFPLCGVGMQGPVGGLGRNSVEFDVKRVAAPIGSDVLLAAGRQG